MKIFKYIFLLLLVIPFLLLLGFYLYVPADVRIFWDYIFSDFEKPASIISSDVDKAYKSPQSYTINLSEARYYEVGFLFEKNSQVSKPKTPIGTIAFNITCGEDVIFKESVQSYVYGSYQKGSFKYLEKVAVIRFPVDHFTAHDRCELKVDLTQTNPHWLSDDSKLYYSLSNHL